MAANVNPSDILTVLKNATESDLDTIKGRVDELETELSYLKSVQKVLAVKFRKPGETERGGVGRSSQGAKMAATREGRMKIAKMLHHSGSMPQPKAAIVKACNLEDGAFEHLTNHQWFMTTAQGVKLTSIGVEALRGQ